MTISCSSCEYHKPESNPHQGKLIPGHHGKCTRPTGLCTEILESADALPRAGCGDDPALIPELTEEHAERDRAVQNSAAAVDQAVMDAEEVFRDLGRLDATLFYATVTDSMLVQIFQKIKKSKAYKSIPIRDESGNLRRSQNLEEFCQLKLGKSYRRLQELSQNIATLGPDLYESAERIGFRAKDYRALKALPEAEQEVVKTAIASESKDEVLSILEDMAARHQAEKEAARKEKEDMAADLEARSKLLEDRGNKLEKVSLQLEKLKSLPPAKNVELKLEREKAAAEALDAAHITYLAESNGFFRAVADILAADEVSAHTKEYAAETVRKCCEELADFLASHGIAVDFQDMVRPEWMRDTARGDLEQGNLQEPSGAHGSW